MLRFVVLGAVFVALADAPVPPAPSAPSVADPPKLTGAGQIRGTISYGRREPAVGAIVVVQPEAGGSPVRAATTGVTGSFAFYGLPDGSYRAEVRREGYAPIVKSGIGVRAPFRAVVEVLLSRGPAAPSSTAPPATAAPAPEGTASLAGTVKGASGSLLGEAKIRLTRVSGEGDSRAALTSENGTFSFSALAAGRWRLDIQGAGLLPLRTELTLAGDIVMEAQLAAQPANYRPLPQDLLVPEEVIPPPGS